MQILAEAELNKVASGTGNTIYLSGSNPRSSDQSTGAAPQAVNGLSNAMGNIFMHTGNDASANFEPKPPPRT